MDNEFIDKNREFIIKAINNYYRLPKSQFIPFEEHYSYEITKIEEFTGKTLKEILEGN